MDDFNFNKVARGMAVGWIINTLIWAAVILGGIYMIASALI